MNFKQNIATNYASQIYVMLISIVILPLYIKYMGAETYGLVGFFAIFQAVFNLLDMGLTPTMARETGRFSSGAVDSLNYKRFVRALEGIFVAVGILGAGIILCASGYISRKWLHANQLPVSEIRTAVQLMAVIGALRWMCGLYRGAVTGAEHLVWLAWYNTFIATLRFVGILPILMYVNSTPTVFFCYQLFVAIVELAGLSLASYYILRIIPRGVVGRWSWKPLRPMLKFSSTIAFTSAVWVIATQSDKLILSKTLPLADYGYYTLAVLVASGVMVVSGPVGGALLPRMVKLEAEGDHAGLIRIYRQSTQLVAVVAGGGAIALAFCAESLLRLWTGNMVLTQKAAPILSLYAMGNGVLAMSAFPYYIQYAKGDVKLHFFASFAWLVLMIPSIIWASLHYGGVGAGYVWLGLNVISFVVWVPLVHNRFVPGLNFQWYRDDVLKIYLFAGLIGYCLSTIMPHSDSRYWLAVQVGLMGLLVVSAGVLASSVLRCKLKQIIWRQRHFTSIMNENV